MSIYKDYLSAQDEMKELKQRIETMQIEIYTKNAEKFNAVDLGTVNLEEGGYKIKVVKKETVSVDQTMAAVVGLAFTSKFSLNKKEYAKLSVDNQKRVDECLTTKPSKPTFSVELI